MSVSLLRVGRVVQHSRRRRLRKSADDFESGWTDARNTGGGPHLLSGAADGSFGEIRRHGRLGSRVGQRYARDVRQVAGPVRGCERCNRAGGSWGIEA